MHRGDRAREQEAEGQGEGDSGHWQKGTDGRFGWRGVDKQHTEVLRIWVLGVG